MVEFTVKCPVIVCTQTPHGNMSHGEKCDDDDFVINAFRRQGCPHQGRGMVLLSLHAMGFKF